MNKKNQANNATSSTTSLYALLVMSSLFVIGSGILASDAAAQNMTGGNATGPEMMASVVNNTNATTSPEASMGTSGVTELSEGNATITNQSGQ